MLAVILAMWLSSTAAMAVPSCTDLFDCKAFFSSFVKPSDYGSINSVESRAIEILVAQDEKLALVPVLLLMLQDKDTDMRRLSGYALSQYSQLPEAILPELITGIEREIPWLARALVAIKTDASARFVVKHMLSSNSSPNNQISFVASKLDNLTLPHINEALKRCKTDCSYRHYYIISSVLQKMSQESRQQAAGLVSVLLEQQHGYELQRWGLLTILRDLGRDAGSHIEQIRTLKALYPTEAELADDVLLAMAAPEQLQIFRQRLISRPGVGLLRQIATLGTQARALQPEVLSLLNHEDLRLRRFAVATLAEIGDDAVLPAFKAVLTNPKDVLLQWYIAKALVKLQLAAAEPLLEQLRSDHWYPPVRQAARGGTSDQQQYHSDMRATHSQQIMEDGGLFLIEPPRLASCSKLNIAQFHEDTRIKLYSEYGAEQLAALQYGIETVSYGAADAEQQRADGRAVIEVNRSNLVERIRKSQYIPEVALKTVSGWLLAGDRGEWGGELMYRDSSNESVIKLIDDNTEDIYLFGEGYLAVTGLGHMGSNRGHLYRLNEASNGNWHVSLWRVLPGSPRNSWLLSNGELHIGTSGGSILVSTDGSMRMAECVNDAQ